MGKPYKGTFKERTANSARKRKSRKKQKEEAELKRLGWKLEPTLVPIDGWKEQDDLDAITNVAFDELRKYLISSPEIQKESEPFVIKLNPNDFARAKEQIEKNGFATFTQVNDGPHKLVG